MEAIWFYVIAIVLGITVVIIYILFVGPSALSKDISGFFTGISSSITSGFKNAY
jgi:Flp pilus assembly pilin Flp